VKPQDADSHMLPAPSIENGKLVRGEISLNERLKLGVF
jgi:hypothetical protein